MAPFTRSKGAAPNLVSPPWGNTKKASADSAEYLPIHSKNNTDLLGDIESPLTSIVSLWPDNSVRSLGPVSIDEKGLSSLPVKEESLVASDDFDLSGNKGGCDNANEPTSAEYETTWETDLLDLKDDSIILHPDNINRWEKVGKMKGRHTSSPKPSSDIAGHSASNANRFDILSDLSDIGDDVAIEKTVKFATYKRMCLQTIEPGERPQALHVVNKGKVQDFCDTGIPGIEDVDLDPEAQQQAWKIFDFLRDEDPELQKVIYDGIVHSLNAFKGDKARGSTPTTSDASPSNTSPSKKDKQVPIIKEMYGEGDMSNKHLSNTPTFPMSTKKNTNFALMVTSMPTPKPTKKVRIVEEKDNGQMIGVDLGTIVDRSMTLSIPLSNTGDPGDMRGQSPMTSLVNMLGNPHSCENPNVQTGPAFVADQVVLNSYLGKFLKKSSSGDGIDVPADDPGDSSSDSSLSSSSDDESGKSSNDSK
ncbi:hypothetical protein IW261DRAFT_1574188 [Armillaria novae-zelandiae]|uniref:Uncharacterized protein n=1 Tax=Armillaria novae-zelandiae TaxID=153914 RepID=A0AA39NKS9_9AGAR|nr:hypothetical protein IW261DRAFT_1574188 [Armillaria novae-zelandiae]